MSTKERPILFSGDMVRAILDGRKTQTRQPIKCCCNQMHNGRLLGTWGLSRPPCRWQGDVDEVNWRHFGRKPKVGDWIEHYQTDVDDYASQVVTCPFGVPGDLLWVRETWRLPSGAPNGWVEYRADDSRTKFCWRPAIHMPRWASRITLEVVSVRAQRVQEITEEDAQAEGVEQGCLTCGENCICTGGCGCCRPCYRESFFRLWEAIYGRDSLDANPWVWAITFRRLKP